MRKLALLASLIASLANAEIIVPPDASGNLLYSYEHPALRSLVFVSPEARQMAILPPSPVFIAPPPLLLHAPTTMPAYPPVIATPGGINMSAHPSNRDAVTYSLQRAHGFSQNQYRSDDSSGAYLYLGTQTPAYGWLSYGSNYPPAMTPGFNQPARPSNRDNATYNLERAHRFSMDGYRQQ